MTFKGNVYGFQRFGMFKMKDSVFMHSSFERTNDILGAINININNLPIIKENEKNNKFIRALFSIEIKKHRNKIITYN